MAIYLTFLLSSYLLGTIAKLCEMKEYAHSNTANYIYLSFYPAILYINYLLLSNYLIIYLLRTIAELCEMKESAHSNTYKSFDDILLTAEKLSKDQ